MSYIRGLKKPTKNVLALLSFLAGTIAAISIYLSGYKFLGIVIGVGMLRALCQYFMTPRSSTKRAIKFIYPPLDALSLVASLALVLAGGYMAVYAGLSAIPSSALSGVLMVIAGIFCASAMFWRRRSQF